MEDHITTFIIEDYKYQTESLKAVSEAVVARVNLFLTIFTASLGALLLFYQGTGFANPRLNYVICAFVTIILVIGFLIYAELTQWVIATVLLYRQIARIQEYFLGNKPELASLGWNFGKDLPISRRKRTWQDIVGTNIGPKQIVTILNNALATTIVAILGLTLTIQDYLVVVICVLTFIGMWIIQFFYARLRYKLAEKSLNIPRIAN